MPKYLYVMSVSAFAGGMITIFAPGNMARASSGIPAEIIFEWKQVAVQPGLCSKCKVLAELLRK